MANTFTQIYIHVVFAVKNRECVVSQSWENELYKYITGIVQNKGQKMLAINGTRDHVHFLIGLKPTCCLSDLVREVKKSSTSFIREKQFLRYPFQWQEGFGAFSLNNSQLNYIISYINSQKEHHKRYTFKNEFEEILKKYQIDYHSEYLFDFFES